MTFEAQSEIILVVDDAPTNRFLLRAILEGSGFIVEECEDGASCIEYCSHTLPSMVLLDVMMPQVDGIEVCKQLRKNHSKDKLPIMMVTTRAEGDDIAEGLEAGANDYVTKPVDRKILLARLENQLTVARSQRQIEEQKASIERALDIQNAMGNVLPQGIAIHDSIGQIIYANAPLTDSCGGTTPDNIDKIFDSIFGGAIEKDFLRYQRMISDNPQAIIDEEVENSKSKGKNKARNIHVISKLVAVDYKTDLRLWLWHDVTEMRELERKINQQVKLDTVSIFASGVAHNFNNIMGGVLGAAEMLRKINKEDQKAQRCLRLIERGVESGSSLTKKMGTLVRHGSEGSTRTASIAKVIENVAEAHREALSESIELDIQTPQPEQEVGIDEQNLYDILDNVVSNALDAMSSGGKLTITSRVERESRFVELCIRDTGIGMPQDILRRVYEPFFSTKNLDTRNGVSIEGNGLGMWNVYNLLKMTDGDIHIASVAGEGTKVSLYLPLPQAQADASDEETQGSQPIA